MDGETSAARRAKTVASYVVLGGGVAGVSCAHMLATSCPNDQIYLISESPLVKNVVNLQQLTRTLDQFDVVERPLAAVDVPNIRPVLGRVASVNTEEQLVNLADGTVIPYTKLCVCTGASPRIVTRNEHVVGVRDIDSIGDLCGRLSTARRIMVVGNGALASELIFELTFCEVIWAVKDSYIGNTFFDSHAAAFIVESLFDRVDDSVEGPQLPPLQQASDVTVHAYTGGGDVLANGGGGGAEERSEHGPAVGPDWVACLKAVKTARGDQRQLSIEYKTEVERIESTPGEEFPARVYTKDGRDFAVDFVVSATGVWPNTGCLGTEFARDAEGALVVNEMMQTSVKNVYAAGDCCAAQWELSSQWFQMRLWSQARTMGLFAAKSTAGLVDRLGSGFAFEMFSHATRLFGFKVILLGTYNAQKLGQDFEIMTRTEPGAHYIKLVLQGGRIQGAMLIGETDLEETFEHLILDAIDVSGYGADLLNPDVDLEDYFD